MLIRPKLGARLLTFANVFRFRSPYSLIRVTACIAIGSSLSDLILESGKPMPEDYVVLVTRWDWLRIMRVRVTWLRFYERREHTTESTAVSRLSKLEN